MKNYMKDRIKKYMDYKSISAGELAIQLEVQRSNISHVLNGRNMPGAAFIEKLLLSYPDINARWLLTGKGDMLMEVESLNVNEEIRQPNESMKPKDTIQTTIPVNVNFEKPADKLILLFSDGTFIDYNKK
jgi:transcriptional regulator with XRE-family HTH domain